MKNGEKMIDSGFFWIGAIPENWNSKPLKKVANIKKGNAFEGDFEKESSAAEAPFPYFNGGKKPSGYSKSANTPGLSVAISEGGASAGFVNWVASPYWCGGHCYGLKPKRIDNKFLFYALKGLEPEIQEQKRGTAMPNLKFFDLLNFRIAVPPQEQQSQIADFLDLHTSRIDREVELLEKKIELMQELRRATIHEAVTKGLDPSVPMKESGAEWIGMMPIEWKSRRLKNLMSLRAGETIAADLLDPSAPYPVYGSNGIRGRAHKFSHEGNFWLIGRQGSAGEVNEAIGRFWPAEHALVVHRKKDVDYRWCGWLLQAVRLPSYVGGTAQPGLAASFIMSLGAPCPSLSVQKNIADFLDKKVGDLISIELLLKRKIELLKEHRKALIFEAVTGKIDVSEME